MRNKGLDIMLCGSWSGWETWLQGFCSSSDLCVARGAPLGYAGSADDVWGLAHRGFVLPEIVLWGPFLFDHVLVLLLTTSPGPLCRCC
jgi:hypothetical protein